MIMISVERLLGSRTQGTETFDYKALFFAFKVDRRCSKIGLKCLEV